VAVLRRTVFLAVLAVALAGCGSAPPPSASLASTPVPASPGPSQRTSASPIGELVDGADPLTPGRYTRASFRPLITFDVEAGWYVGSLASGFFDIQQQQDTPDVIAVQFALVDGVVGPGGAMTSASTAGAAAEVIAANPGLVVLGESESRLGGLTGFNLEVENQGPAHAPIIDVPVGTLGIDPARRLWISLFDTDDGLLAVMVGGSVADWDHALAVAEPVLESIAIGEPPPT
jgi:hypothetical protein